MVKLEIIVLTRKHMINMLPVSMAENRTSYFSLEEKAIKIILK